MSVYRRDNVEFFEQAIKSVCCDQSLLPDQVVLVVDGPVPEGLSVAIKRWAEIGKDRLEVLWLPVNLGLAGAMNEGLKLCRHEYVARMDGDDISVPNRFEIQMSYLEQHPEVDLLGGWYQQYDSTMSTLVSDRKVPSGGSTLTRFSKTRTPFNHVTAIFKKSSVLATGGYPKIEGYVEDWWIGLRLLKDGRKIVNLPEHLVRVRGDAMFMQRRGGWRYLKLELENLLAMRKEGLISYGDLLRNLMLRSTLRLMPNGIRSSIYRVIRKV